MRTQSYQSSGTSNSTDKYAYDLEEGIPVNETTCKRPGVFGLLSMICFAAALILLVTTKTESTVSDTDSSSTFENIVQVNYSVTGSNPDYGEPSRILSYLPWNTLVEPYRENTLTMSSLIVDDVDVTDKIGGDYTVTWTLDEVEYEGSPVAVFVENIGVMNATVYISYQGDVVSQTHYPIAVKYIRREIRSLTDTERSAWVSTMKMLYTTSLEDGQNTYGGNFYNAEWFSYQHLNGAGRNDCDHWHDGAAIATIHLGFTLVAERALQSINPSLSMPYWEYAHDYLLYDSWDDSAVFADDVLGVASPTTADYSLQTGVWANISVPDGSPYTEWDVSAQGSLNPFVNGYGWLRSPWNNNPTPLLSRHGSVYGTTTTTMPTCELMAACYKSDKLTSMNDCLNGVTHGPVHILVGGCWGEGDTLDGLANLRGIDKLLYFKMLWRMGYTRCPTSCNPGDTCSCAIPEEYFDTVGAFNMLNNSGVWAVISDHLADTSLSGLTSVLRGLQDPAVVGEMFTSMASYDPSFWPLHGQLDRILSRKRAQSSRGIVTKFDQTWGWTSTNTRYTQGVCDWSNVKSNDDLTLPICDMGEGLVVVC
jgi:hypothetical protein